MAAGLPKMPRTDCAVCKASTGCCFTHLPLAERSPLNALIRHHTYQRGEMIFQQGAVISECYILCEGKIRLTRGTTRRSQYVVRLLSSGDLFGASALVEAKASLVEARALTESVVGWLNLSDLQGLLRRDPLIALELQKRLAQEVSELYVRLAEQANLGIHGRLIQLLLELGQKYGRISERELLIDLELTEQEIAEMLGSSREWISKQMSKLQRRGLIYHGRGKTVILDEAGLRRIIAPPPPHKHQICSRFWNYVNSVHTVNAVHRQGGGNKL
jgi:CRP/FNR family transcriptional regulator